MYRRTRSRLLPLPPYKAATPAKNNPNRPAPTTVGPCIIAAPAVDDEEAADPLALDVPDVVPEPVVVVAEEDSDVDEESEALEVMVDESLDELPAPVAVDEDEGALVDEAVPEPAVAL